MEELLARYELLCKDVKHQITYIDDFYVFDFEHFLNVVKEMASLQEELKKED